MTRILTETDHDLRITDRRGRILRRVSFHDAPPPPYQTDSIDGAHEWRRDWAYAQMGVSIQHQPEERGETSRWFSALVHWMRVVLDLGVAIGVIAMLAVIIGRAWGGQLDFGVALAVIAYLTARRQS